MCFLFMVSPSVSLIETVVTVTVAVGYSRVGTYRLTRVRIVSEDVGKIPTPAQPWVAGGSRRLHDPQLFPYRLDIYAQRGEA